MALRRRWAYASIVMGFGILALTIGCIVGGAVSMSNLNNVGLASGGLWAIYFLIPAVMLLVAGFGRYFTLFAISIGANVVGVLTAFAGVLFCAAVWSVLNATCNEVPLTTPTTTSTCVCEKYLYDDDDRFLHDGPCDDVETARDANAAATIFYVVLFILSVVALIIGSVATCCDRRARVHGARGHYYYRPEPKPFVIPYEDPHAVRVTRVVQRDVVEDPYYVYRPAKRARGLDVPYYYRNLRHESAYLEPRRGRIVENPLVVERHYNNGPSYVKPPPSLPYRKDDAFAGYKNKPYKYTDGDIFMW